jgi:M6 family metalloprotease-like protein
MKKTILLLCSILLCQLSRAQQVSIPNVIKGVTVMLSFQDYPINDPIQAVDDLMNKQGYTGNGQLGSVRDYFYTQTSGKVVITSTIVKVTLAHTQAYYDDNNVNYVDEAIDLINQNYPAGFQDLTADPFDGKLMHLNFIARYPGRSSTVGASAGKFFKNNTTGQLEIVGGNMTYFNVDDPLIINVICHEMGHSVMSWTDYYRTAYSNLGNFCVMGSAGTAVAPMPINPALRMQRGWIDNIIPVSGTTTQTYTLTANSYTTIHKYTNPNNPKEYLLFHAFKHGGYYQPVVGGPMPEGLAIWYVDEETGYDSPLNPNNDNQYYIRLVQADNKDEMHDEFLVPADVRGDMEDLYGNANKSFPNGTPFRWKDGGEFGINITNISSPGATMQFTVTARPNTVVSSSDIFGTIAPKGTLGVASGQTKTFSLTPNPGYEVNVLKVDNATVTAANPYTMSGISGTKTISVTYKRKTTQTALPSPWQKATIGSVSSSDFVAHSGTNFYMETYGNTVGGSGDNFTFTYQLLNGDGTYIAHLGNYNTLESQRTGIMIRESLQPDAAFSAIAKIDMGGAIVQQRASSGGLTQDNPNDQKNLHIYELHNWLKIVRSGNVIVSSVSKDGVTWYEIGNQNISMASQVYVGLFTKGTGYTTYPAQALFDTISFTSSPFPTVHITSPATGTVLSSNSVTINATAAPAAANGSITKVDFYDNTTLIGTDNTAPYSFVWNNVSGGIHALIAKATDNTGKVAVSAKVAIVAPCTAAGSKLQGTVIGTPGSWNGSGNTREKAFDGNINTYFDASVDVAWTGLDLSATYKVTTIRYVPRAGLEGRMIGGKFQGSNAEDFSTYTDLATVVAKPSFTWNCFDVSSTASFKYLRYIGPEGGVGNIAEIEFYGTPQAANQLPTVVITSPENGNTFTSPATITIHANAADADGSIVKVEFYSGVNYLNRDTVAPYSTTISNLPSGVYSFTARAYDNEGATSEYTVTNITVGTNTAPVVSITSPVTNQSFSAPATIVINTDVTDAEGNIWKVEFYNGSTWLGSDFTAPYSYTWSNVPAGVYNITALAIDNLGASASSTRNNIAVVGNTAPTVSITSPVTNQSYTAPATIYIDVIATDADGSITKVDFYNGSTLLGSDLTAPYSFTWSNVPAGVYNITALAIDNLGASASSTRNNIAVIANQAPTVSITSPLTNASYTAPATIIINATAADADGSIWKVEFYNGSTWLGSDFTAPYSYTWNNVPAGVYNITALAIDNLNATASSTRNNIAVTAPAADITGPACAGNNTTITYELAASKRVNATSYGWYFTGSTQSFTPSATTQYQATLVTGNNYGQGQLCVGVGYASAPYHTTYCITLPKCATSREASFEESESLTLQPVGFPNPFASETTINLAAPDSKIEVYNASGILVEETIASGSFTFGQHLASGIYFVKVTTGNKTETLKVVKE